MSSLTFLHFLTYCKKEQLNAYLIALSFFREVIVQEMAKSRLQSTFKRRVVFDLDQLIIEEKQNQQMSSSPGKVLDNSDLNRLGMVNENEPLKFESRFESGNLRKAIQVMRFLFFLLVSRFIFFAFLVF